MKSLESFTNETGELCGIRWVFFSIYVRFFLCFLIVSNDSELQQLEVNSLTDNSQWKLMLGKEFKGLWLLEHDCQNQVQSMGKSSHHEDYLDWGRRWVNTVRDSNCETGSYLDKVWCWVHYCIWWLCMVNSNHQAGVRNNLSHPRKSASLKFICVQIPSTHLHPNFNTIWLLILTVFLSEICLKQKFRRYLWTFEFVASEFLYLFFKYKFMGMRLFVLNNI